MAVAALDAAASDVETDISYSISSGTNRCLVGALGDNDASGSWDPSGSWGGQSMERAVISQSASPNASIALFVLDEAGIAAGSGTTLDMTNGSNDWAVLARSYEGVGDQENIYDPTTATDSSETDNTTMSATLTIDDGNAGCSATAVYNFSVGVGTPNYTGGDLTNRTESGWTSSFGSRFAYGDLEEGSGGGSRDAVCSCPTSEDQALAYIELLGTAPGGASLISAGLIDRMVVRSLIQ